MLLFARLLQGTAIHHQDLTHSNRLLAALPEPVRERWLPQLERMALRQGDVLVESGASMPYVYFPATAVLSLQHLLQDGSSTEVAMVGAEGMLEISVCLGGGGSWGRVVVQNTGTGYRLRSDVVRSGCEGSAPTLRLTLRFARALGSQIAQIAVCNRHHTVEQQLCRCLLMCTDRVGSTHLAMTQELIANLLGVRREGVTEAAQKLQRSAAIQYTRGHIHVNDRAALQAHSCECYGAICDEYARLLP